MTAELGRKPLRTIGLDLGGTKILGVVADEVGAVQAELRRPTPAGSADEALARLVETVAELRAQQGAAANEAVAAVGVGAAGLVDRDGALRFAPNIPALSGTPLRVLLAEATGLPVCVDNDANAAAWGEVVYGAARGLDQVLVVTLGTGIGGGMIIDGKLSRGAHGFAAEIGHMTVVRDGPPCACGGRGHWEAIASGPALARAARERAKAGNAPQLLRLAAGEADKISGFDVGRAAAGGDADASALLDDYAEAVALGLAGLANVLDPERIVIGGGIVQMGALLMDRIRRAFAGHLEGASVRPEISIVGAMLGEKAGAIGAAAQARDLALPRRAGGAEQ